MKTLSEMIDDEIVVLIPVMHPKEMQRVKLLAVEPGGIWIESQKFTNHFLGKQNVQTAPRTGVFFFPFSQLAFVMASYDAPALDEKAFGV